MTGKKVTTESLIATLVQFIRQQGNDVASKKVDFTLNPVCIRALANELKHTKNDGSNVQAKTGVPVIRNFVTRLDRLKIVSNRPQILEDRKEIDLNVFGALASLELDYVKPSLIVNLDILRDCLERLVIHNALNSLEELLDFEVDNSLPWPLLTELDCSHNNIPKIDTSMLLAYKVRKLDLSFNLLKDIDNLEQCILLDILNLSVNHLSNVTHINRKIGNIRVLSLRNNNISDIGDLDKLYSLEQLDLSFNEISEQNQVDRLGSLPILECLWLEGNPVTQYDNYRYLTFLSFGQRFQELQIDGNTVSSTEFEQIRSARALQAVQKVSTSQTNRKRKIRKRLISVSSENLTRTDGVIESNGEHIEEFKSKINDIRDANPESWLTQFQDEFIDTCQTPDIQITSTSSKPRKRRKTKTKTPDREVGSLVVPSHSAEHIVTNSLEKSDQPTEGDNNPAENYETLSNSLYKEFCAERHATSTIAYSDNNFSDISGTKKQLDYCVIVVTRDCIIERGIEPDEEPNVSISLSHLARVEEGSFDSIGNARVSLFYYPEGVDRVISAPTEIIYHIHQEDEAKDLVKLITALIADREQNSVPANTTDTKELNNDAKTEKNDIVDATDAPEEQTTSKETEERKPPPGQPVNSQLDQGEVNYNTNDVDQNLRWHLENEYFSGVEDEDFVFLLRCTHILFNSKENRQYLTCQFTFRLQELDSVVNGLFLQWFRIQTADSSHVCITRSHGCAHEFLKLLQQQTAALMAVPGSGVTVPLYFFNLNRQVFDNMSDDLLSSQNAKFLLENYFTAYLVVSPGEEAFHECTNPSNLQIEESESIKPVTFISTFDGSGGRLILCEENLLHWPVEDDQEQLKGAIPHFVCLESQSLTHIVKMEIDSAKPYWLSISFGTIDTAEVKTWSLYLPDLKSKQLLFFKLSSQFKEVLRSRFPVVDRIQVVTG